MKLGRYIIDADRKLVVEVEYENVIFEDAFSYIRFTFDDIDVLMETLDEAMYDKSLEEDVA